MNIFYDPSVKEGAFVLSGDEGRHGTKVMRLKEGDNMYISDGQGKIFEAEIIGINKKSECAVMVNKVFKNDAPRIPKLHIAIAPTKSIDRFEWFLEKATECGIDEITPIICKNSERTRIKPERLEKIIVSAMKQSKRAWLPKLNPIIEYDKFIKNASEENRYIAFCPEGEKVYFEDVYKKGNNSLILIGPEGDFNQSEIAEALNNKFVAITFGDYRLRTETAGLVACTKFNTINGDL